MAILLQTPNPVPCTPHPSRLPGLLAAMAIRSLDALAVLLGPDSPAVQDLRRLFSLAAGYGYTDWLVFDPSVVRGLAYYTGVCLCLCDSG